MSAGMWFAVVCGLVLGAVPAVFIVYVVAWAVVLAAKECAAWWRRRSRK